MANDIFIDTSGFFALISREDKYHTEANQCFVDAARNKQYFITTDYVLVETATLIKARRMSHQLRDFFKRVENARTCHTLWTDEKQFTLARDFFIKHQDQAWSFTDCHSFLTMKQLKLLDALTADHHFAQAGFNAILS